MADVDAADDPFAAPYRDVSFGAVDGGALPFLGSASFDANLEDMMRSGGGAFLDNPPAVGMQDRRASLQEMHATAILAMRFSRPPSPTGDVVPELAADRRAPTASDVSQAVSAAPLPTRRKKYTATRWASKAPKKAAPVKNELPAPAQNGGLAGVLEGRTAETETTWKRDEAKKSNRLRENREAARRCRENKKRYVMSLEARIAELERENRELMSRCMILESALQQYGRVAPLDSRLGGGMHADPKEPSRPPQSVGGR